IRVDELSRRIAAGEAAQVLDVRRPGEWNAGHIAQASHRPLHELEAHARELDRSSPVAIICASGFRSSIATSLLERAGFPRVTNVVGGMNAWHAASLPTSP